MMETVYHQPKPSIRSIISDFIAMPGVTIVDKTDFEEAFTFWPETFEDFGDAIIAASARSAKGASVITFDRRFMRKLASCHIPFIGSKSR